MSTQKKKVRDYKAEYARRIQRGFARGLSRAQARGHAKASDITTTLASGFIDRASPLERALQLMRKGVSQSKAAKEVGVSSETLRRYQRLHTRSERVGRRWIIRDVREVGVLLASRGKLETVKVTREAASDIGKYWAAVNKFLQSNRTSHLDAFVGMGIRDVRGKLHSYETRPNVLRRLDSAGDFSFIDIYRQTGEG